MSQSTLDSIRQIMPFFSQYLSRSTLKGHLEQEGQGGLYWRALTPMVVLWGFIYQRLGEQTCDAYVAYLHAGGADKLDAEDPHQQPLSQRLHSVSNSAYAQGRKRLLLAIIEKARDVIQQQIADCLGEEGRWKGHYVRLLDGTTFRLRPYGDLVQTYGQSSNQRGTGYWVMVRAIAAFDLFSQAAVGLVEGAQSRSEAHMVGELLQQESQQEVIYVGDRNFGIYATVQAIQAAKQACLFRLKANRAQALLKRNKLAALPPGQSVPVHWQPTRHDHPYEDLPALAVAGRLLYVHLHKAGFRPLELYLFTTLLDEESYPLLDLVVLYGQRWQVEVDLRHVKTTMHMREFAVQSAALFRKELSAGFLAYNLTCALMTMAATRHDLTPIQLSFSSCLHRVNAWLFCGLPDWLEPNALEEHLLSQLARCTLPTQPNKAPFEPRKVRSKPRPYPPLRGNRDDARLQLLLEMAIS